MKEFIDKLIGRLEEYEQERLKMYDWQGQSATSDAIVIIKDIADEYRTCYKSCMECEAYNKEKHYCPKWCDVIKNTISELAEEYKVSELPTGWIPCERELPRLGQKCICTVNKARFKDAKNDVVVAIYKDFYIDKWQDWYTAWMPLPPAWKGDCDGKA